MEPAPQPVKNFRTFEYAVSTRWSHDRIGAIGSAGKPEIDVASPPEFKGVPGIWTPEDLLVAAVNVCQMTTFLALASRAGLPLVSYESSGRGSLEHVEDGYRFTRIELAPRIAVPLGTSEAEVKRLVEDAHRSCLIGRSVSAKIIVSPEILIG